MTKREYERPEVIDYGSIVDHTFGDTLSKSLVSPSLPGGPDVPSL